MAAFVLRSVCVDCSDPLPLATFWAAVLGSGWHVREGSAAGDDGVAVDPPDRGTPTRVLPNIWFNRVPDPTPGKNKLHIDVNVAAEADVERILALGATMLRRRGSSPDLDWHVLADPEGNEFCVFEV